MRRVLVLRGGRLLYVLPGDVLESDQTPALKAGEEKRTPLGEGSALGRGEACPLVLGRQGWGGVDGLSEAQFRAAGAPFPDGGGVTFWLGPSNVIYQFRRQSRGDFVSRSCSYVGGKEKAAAAVSALSSLSPAELREFKLA